MQRKGCHESIICPLLVLPSHFDGNDSGASHREHCNNGYSGCNSPGLGYYDLPSGAEQICHNRNKFFQKRVLGALFKKDTIGQILAVF